MDVAQLLSEFAARGQTIAVAESVTGGLLGSALVDVPGASEVLRGGVIVYATDLKASLGGVPRALLDERGPVDPDVALALAEGVRDRCDADWGVAITGVAGPESHDGKAVGTVYVAVAGAGVSQVRLFTLDGDRAAVRAGAVTAALALLAGCLTESA